MSCQFVKQMDNKIVKTLVGKRTELSMDPVFLLRQGRFSD